MTVGVLSGLTALVALSRILVAVLAQRYVARWRRREPHTGLFPHVSVIAPHRGALVPENIEALLEQDYEGRWDVFFVTTEDDAARGALQGYADKYPRVRLLLARDVVQLATEEGVHRGQKCENLLTAVTSASADTEVFACIDADVWPSKDWLRSLVEPLSGGDRQIGATTLSRVYLPDASLASNIQAAWLMGGAGLLLGSTIFTWGGSCAFRKSVLENTEVLKCWRGLKGPIPCDDLNLTSELARCNFRICYVPGPLAIGRVPERRVVPADVLRFTNRQLLHAWWARKNLFRRILIPSGVGVLTLLAGVCVAPWHPQALVALAIPLVDLLTLWPAALRLEAASTDGRIPPGALQRAVWRGGAFATLLATINCIAALFTKEMIWGGIAYTRKVVAGIR